MTEHASTSPADDAQQATSGRGAVALAVVAVVVMVAAPARVWLLAAVHGATDPSTAGSLTAFWLVAGLLPTVVGVITWLLLRRRPPGRRFVLAATAACLVGFVTIIPITPYVFAF